MFLILEKNDNGQNFNLKNYFTGKNDKGYYCSFIKISNMKSIRSSILEFRCSKQYIVREI